MNKEADKEVLGVEIQPKKKIIRRILFVILAIILLSTLILAIKNITLDMKTDKLKNEIEKVSEDKVTYVIIEINPKIILELKNNRVVKTGCLNDDCKKIYTDIDVKNKDLKSTIDLLYNTAKESNIDTSKGVSISSTDPIIEKETKELEYVNYKKINQEEEQNYISQVLDNNEIKNQVSKENYHQEILKTYQTDPNYGYLYTCNIKNSELECYITESFADRILTELTLTNIYFFIGQNKQLMSIFDKFNISYKTTGIEGKDFTNVSVSEIYNEHVNYPIISKSCYNNNCYDKYHIILYDKEDSLDLVMKILPISKINLVNLKYDAKDAIILNNNNSNTIIGK